MDVNESKRLIIGINTKPSVVKRRMKEWYKVPYKKPGGLLEVNDWCDSNIEGSWLWSGYHSTYYFELTEDATLFRLTWL